MLNVKKKFSLSPYLQEVEKAIDGAVLSMGDKTSLRDACEYALKSGGKRFRPLIVYFIAESLNKGFDVTHAALAVEFFHTASLIADDLPCMDNDDLRRNKPATHKEFGESVAILASYTLISSGYERLYLNAETMRKKEAFFDLKSAKVCKLALQTVTKCAGIFGATNGQFLDLYPPKPSKESFEKIIYQKTITLFEISFVLGYLFGGGNPDRIAAVKKCAYHLGYAFQVADDLQDLNQDSDSSSNIAQFIGKEQAHDLYAEHKNAFLKACQEVKILHPGFVYLCDLLDGLVKE